MEIQSRTVDDILAENGELRRRLEDAEETLRAIRQGEVDALVVGERLYTLQGVDAESNRFRGEVLGQIHDAVLVTDNAGYLTYLNATAEQQYGVRASEALGMALEEIYQVRWEKPGDQAAVARALKEEGHWRGENIHIKRCGEEIYAESSINHILDPNGKRIGLIVAAHDITSRKRAEKAVTESDARLSTAIDNLQEGVIITSESAQVIYWNPAALMMHGFKNAGEGLAPLAELHKIFELMEPETGRVLPLVDWPMSRIMQGESVYKMELRLRRQDQGWERLVSYTGSVVQTATGERLILLSIYDLTDYKRAQHALQESESQFRALADSIPNLAWWANADGYTTWYNRRWYEYTGTTPEQMEGWGWQMVHDPEMLPEVLEQWRASLKSGEPFNMDFPLRGADGSYRWFLTRTFPLRDDSGKIVRWFGTCTDATDNKRFQTELERLVVERTASLQETVTELRAFSYSVSHDLRSPLRAMQGYSQALLEEASEGLSPEHRNHLKRIYESAARLDRLTQEILAYSRLSTREVVIAPVAIGKLAHDIIEHYPNLQAFRSSIKIEDPLLDVMGNEPFLTQAISNLLANAVKFVEPGTNPRVVVKTARMENYVRFSVEDNGIGILPEHQDRIFKIFGRIHPESRYEGTGIGLAIVKRSIERLNGRVGFESIPGKGSKFWFDLVPVPARPAQPMAG